MLRTPLAFACAAASAALLAAGCGSANTKSTPAAASGSPSSQTSSAAPPPAPASAKSSVSPAASSGVLITTKHAKLGTILAAGPKKLTVYLFEGDKGAVSMCSGACAQAWPPVTSTGAPRAGAGAIAADLGTITRPDGTTQLTYKGHPLYYFVKDQDSGDAYGQAVNAFGASWYVLKPSGVKLDNS